MPPPPQAPCHCPPPSCDKPPEAAPPGGPDPGTPTTAPPATSGQDDLSRQYAATRALEVLRGQATYYGDSLAGNKTASGEVYDPRSFTAAHRTLPFGTVVRVIRTDRDPPRITYVRITDRGPFGARRRIIDLSRAAAEQLDMIRDGVVEVRVEVVAHPQSP